MVWLEVAHEMNNATDWMRTESLLLLKRWLLKHTHVRMRVRTPPHTHTLHSSLNCFDFLCTSTIVLIIHRKCSYCFRHLCIICSLILRWFHWTIYMKTKCSWSAFLLIWDLPNPVSVGPKANGTSRLTWTLWRQFCDSQRPYASACRLFRPQRDC